MRPLRKWIGCLSLLLLLSGCVEKEVLDDISLIEGIGFDLSEDGKILGTVTFPLYLKNAPPKNQTFSAEAKIKKSFLQEVQKQTSDPIVTGSLEIVLFGKDIARKEGILELIDAFQRDPGVGAGLYLAVIDGEAKSLLEGEYGIRGNGTFLANLLEHNIKQEEIPRTNLHLFLADFYQEGKTPFLPQLKQTSKKKIEITGIALFSQGKVIDVIPPEKMFSFKLLVDRFSEGMHQVSINEGDAAIRSIRSSHKFELSKRNPEEINIHIKVKGVINEFTGNNLTPKLITKLEKQFEEDINKECLSMIEKFKEKELDPIGLGRYVKTQTKNFNINKWRNTEYKNLKVKVTSDVVITETGVIQ
ncbi:Ger(x)C family spore germination protein [Niallia endozanthoxylica]|uniref:Ger(X)C family spore germination protein n=1 Tax=Niallia endozanthoxylica TaxID=2036016 RepID=A0A5J5HER4_9BACI|nr:Ger(x)C family spore germination protein [Niallia endozanthoxylica]KAA9017974.1 Ger(x)C family spore germination protein [Niallia endozanthoxylica]